MADRPSELWLIRHGETEWAANGRHTGRTDIPLTAVGKRQGEALGRHLAGRKFALVLSSPLGRAVETCRLAGYGDVAKTTDDLLEWNYGDYEGRTTVDIRREVPGWAIFKDGVPHGESAADVGGRAENVIKQALTAGGDVALFSHGHMLRVLAATWLGLPPESGRFLALGTAAVSVLGYERETRVIRVWNQDWHLVRSEPD
jgi:broad specificity phosphatase PhoE